VAISKNPDSAAALRITVNKLLRSDKIDSIMSSSTRGSSQMRKTTVALAAFMALGLAACGAKKEEAADAAATEAAATEAAATEAAATDAAAPAASEAAATDAAAPAASEAAK
jgi:hypothetical protein